MAPIIFYNTLSTSPRVQFRNIDPKLTEKEMTNLKYYTYFKSQE